MINLTNVREKLLLENRELVFEDVKSDNCQGKSTHRIAKIKKKIKEIEEKEEITEETALEEVQDDTIEETDTTI